MARKGKYSTNYFDSDDNTWVVTGTVYFGRPGTYEDPPEGDEVNLETVDEELPKDIQGPCRQMTFDAFAELMGLTEAQVDEISAKLGEEAADLDGDCDEPDYEEYDYPESDDYYHFSEEN